MMRWGEWLVRASTHASTLLSDGDSACGDDSDEGHPAAGGKLAFENLRGTGTDV